MYTMFSGSVVCSFGVYNWSSRVYTMFSGSVVCSFGETNLLLKGGDILGFVPLRLVPFQLISHTLFGFITCHPFWPNGGSTSGGALLRSSSELAKIKLLMGGVDLIACQSATHSFSN